MKFHPITPGNPQRKKIQYEVTIDNSVYVTWAFTEEAALSNACFRHAEEVDEDVALIKWQVKNEKLYSNVEEV